MGAFIQIQAFVPAVSQGGSGNCRQQLAARIAYANPSFRFRICFFSFYDSGLGGIT